MEKSFPAYTGSEPFVFVCYAHADADLVYPEIRRLQESAVHLWYDEGISPVRNGPTSRNALRTYLRRVW